MKVCFPAEFNKGLDSVVYGHFGSAPVFIIFDTETLLVSTINNQDLGHGHGSCNPLQALDGNLVDAVVVGGIGGGAVSKLNQKGIKVYKAEPGTVMDNMQFFNGKQLKEITASDACSGHAGTCTH